MQIENKNENENENEADKFDQRDTYPIDFVVAWVDGNDPIWQKDKAKYSPSKNSDSRNIRYRDWDNMQYWFRAVEKFAPWVNKIHFVTYGHLPKWLDTKNPKLHIVNHKDFIPSKYLPTFSVRPIELNLHRIPGLSEHFVYFNDDMFLLTQIRKISPTSLGGEMNYGFFSKLDIY